ncbi:unnamed protein product [Thlaspi arvense]|uniref:Uncharacterized protein n=1 Tax=Thlaspi arvense TaxID=13288 RepID=A0AAU9S6A7_THLAR|nr:unnamed protein product [Thlaspi arvense]
MESQQSKIKTPLEIEPDHHDIAVLNSESPSQPLPETEPNQESPPRASSNEPMKKIVTPDRLRLPVAFKHPERYRSPTDAMVSPVTKGLLARSRKASGSLIPPSFNLTKIQDLRKPESGLSSVGC